MCEWCSADNDESLKFEGLTLASMLAQKNPYFFFLSHSVDFCDPPGVTETSHEHLVSVLQEM